MFKKDKMNLLTIKALTKFAPIKVSLIILPSLISPAYSACTNGNSGANDIVCDGVYKQHIYLGTGEDELILRNGARSSHVWGEFNVTNGGTASSNTFIIDNSKIEGYWNSRILGDGFSGKSNVTSATDTFIVKNKSFVNKIEGDHYNGGVNNKGAKDIITVDDSKMGTVWGDRFHRNTNAIAAGDEITIRNKSIITKEVTGDVFDDPRWSGTGPKRNWDSTGGNNNIKVIDSTVKNIHGVYAYEGVQKITAGENTITVSENSNVEKIYGSYFKGEKNVAADDTITVDSSTVGEIYGEYVTNQGSISKSGDDTVNLKNGAKITGRISMDANGPQITNLTKKGGSDKLNISGTEDVVALGIIHGGDDLSENDGAIDSFNYINYSGKAVDSNKVQNFELYNLENSAITYGADYESGKHIAYSIGANSTAKYTGNSTINANVTNAGVIDLTNNNTADDNITIVSRGAVVSPNGTDGDDGSKGNFDHTGVFKSDVDFASLKADTITVEGDFSTKKSDGSAGEGLVKINNINKSNNPNTVQEIDLVIAANDNNPSDENLNLVTNQRYNGNARQGLLGNDPYIWELKTKENGSGHNWILTYLKEAASDKTPTRPQARPEIPAYTSLTIIGKEQSDAEQQRMHARLGELRNRKKCGDICLDEENLSGWLRAYGGKTTFDGKSGFALNGDYKGMSLGFDKRIYTTSDLTLYTGVFAGKHDGDWDTSGKGSQVNAITGANLAAKGWSVGAYATAFTRQGTYVDGVLKYTQNKANITAPSHAESIKGYALTGSVEVGHSFTLKNQWVVEPQAQVTVTKVDWDDVSAGGSQIVVGDHTYVTGRLGVRVEKNVSTASGEFKPWVYAGVNHEFSDSPNMTYGSTQFAGQENGISSEFRLGLTADIKPGFSIYGDVGYTSDFDDYENTNGHLGVRATW